MSPSEYTTVSTEHLNSLYARVAELEAKRKYIPVSERLPESGKRVFVHMSNDYEVIAVYYANRDIWKNDNGQETKNVVSWMPLPPPPESEDK